MPTIDFFEKEVKRLQQRFNETLGQAKTISVMVRYVTILTICRMDLIARSIKESADEQTRAKMTKEFCNKREGLNKFFDLMESQQTRRNQHGYEQRKRCATTGG